MRILMALASSALLALSAPGVAQEEERFRPPSGGEGEAIIYRDAYYSGPAVNVSRNQPDLGLVWQVRSIRVRSGNWQLCSGRNFTGRCTTMNRDTPNITNQFRQVQSMRLVGGGNPPGGGGPGQSLRGMGAEFFPAPMRYGQRIQCPGGQSTANCAKTTADQFCRSAGWNGSRNQSLQTVGRSVYIADVLCVRSGY